VRLANPPKEKAMAHKTKGKKRGKGRKHNPAHHGGGHHKKKKGSHRRRRRNPGGPMGDTMIAAGVGVVVGLLGNLAINKLAPTASPAVRSAVRAIAAGGIVVLGARRSPALAAAAAGALLIPVGQTLVRQFAPDAPIGAVEMRFPQLGAVEGPFLPAPSMEAVEYVG